LVITLGGTYPATPVIFAAMRWDMTLLANGPGIKEPEFYAIARWRYKANSCSPRCCKE
jgi:hypothetical protein